MRRNRNRSRIVRSAAPPLFPATLNPLAWSRSDVTDTTTDFIWTDTSGNSRPHQQTTAGNKPTIVASALHGYPAIRFDGSDDFLANSGAPSVWQGAHDGTGFESWTMVIPRAASPAGYLWSTYTAGAAAGVALLFNSATVVRAFGTNSTGAFTYDITTASLPAVFAQNAPVLLQLTYTENPTGGAAKAELYANNTLVGSSATANAPSAIAPPATLNIGRRANATNYAQIDVFEDLRIARILTATERTNLWTYFRGRYAL